MIVYDQNRKAVELKKELGAGGEGTVYRISNKECAKIYTKPSSFKEAKITTMIAKPPYPLTDPKCRNGRVAWPTRALYKRPGGQFIGYVMPLIQLNQYQESEVVFIEKLRTKTYGYRFTYEHLMIAAYNFAMTVHYIHQAGHSVGDLREKNILVDDRGQVCLVDCDSFQIIDEVNRRFYASQTYTPAYLAPELIGKDLAKANRRNNDHFALGVWIFQMLMNGMHPYQAKGGKANHAPSLSEKIKKGTYPYAGARGVQPPPAAPDFNQVPKSLQALFTACFVKGHRNPDARPEAIDYAKVLKREIGRLKTCKVNRYHKYSGDRVACPFCKKKSKTGSAPRRTSQAKLRQKVNQQVVPIALQNTQPKPVAQVNAPTHQPTVQKIPLPAIPKPMTPSPKYSYGSTTAVSRPVIHNFSALLLVIMLAAGSLGLIWGLANLIGGAASGFADEQAITVTEKPVESKTSSLGHVIDRLAGLPKRIFSTNKGESGIRIVTEEEFQKKLDESTQVQEANAIQVVTQEEFLETLESRVLLVDDFDTWYDGGTLYLNRWEDNQHHGPMVIEGKEQENAIGVYIPPREADEGRHVMMIELEARRSGKIQLVYGAESEWCYSSSYGQYQLTFCKNALEVKRTPWMEHDEMGFVEISVERGDFIQIELREKSGLRGTLNPVIAFLPELCL